MGWALKKCQAFDEELEVRLLRATTFLMGLLVSTQVRAEAPPCAEWGGVVESEQLYFLDPAPDSAQSALIDFQGPFASSWLQAHVKGSRLVLRNKMPGLGLPTTIYHVQVEWVAQLGGLVSSVSFPEEGVCESLSLFPGQYSPDLDLKRPDSLEPLRLRLKVWAVGR